MGADLTGYRTSETPEYTAPPPMPAGVYPVIMVASEMKATKHGDGQLLELRFQVCEGVHQGRLLWDRLNWNNPNEDTVRRGRGTLTTICNRLGVVDPKDTAELHDRPLQVQVALKPHWKDPNAMANEIVGYPDPSAVEAPPQSTSGCRPVLPMNAPWAGKKPGASTAPSATTLRNAPAEVQPLARDISLPGKVLSEPGLQPQPEPINWKPDSTTPGHDD